MAGDSLKERIRAHATALGFDDVGVTTIRPSEHAAFYLRWLADGRHGEMGYLARDDAVTRRLRPDLAWPELRSAVVVAQGYDPGGSATDPGPRYNPATDRSSDDLAADRAGDPSKGIIARYARGRDYHRVIKAKLLDLLHRIEADVGRELPAARAYADTGPVLERELARRAGLGWSGRNTMLIHPRRGSYFFLGSLLLELELEPDPPFEADRCGTCTRCLEACPTGALLGRDAGGAPVMDATRCIAYLTIEQRGPIPHELRPLMGNRIFGCDICQEVCPFTQKFSRPSREPAYATRGPGEAPAGVEEAGASVHRSSTPGTDGPRLVDLMCMDRDAWDAFTRGSPIRRAGYGGLRRNVAIALGNWLARAATPEPAAVDALVAALSGEDETVAEGAAWALAQAKGGAGE